jgi:signal transduction histidine kinase
VGRLHSRIYLHSLLVLLVVALATIGVFALGARGPFQREVAERLARHVASLAGEHFHDPETLARRLRRLHDDLEVDITVRDLTGRLMGSAGAAVPALAPGEAAEVRAGRVVVAGRPVWHAAVLVRDPGSGAPLGILTASTHRHGGFAGLLRPLLMITVILIIVAIATRPLARRIARPLERLTEAARRLGGGDLTARVPAPASRRPGDGDLTAGAPAPPARRSWRRRQRRPDELAELTRAFNEMAERVERNVRGQQELLANVSHELRSPLARVRMALELVPRDADGEARLRDIERDLADLDRVIEDVLTTSRLEMTGLPTRLESVDVQALLAELAERALHDPVLAGQSVSVAAGPPLTLVADAVLLRRALWNLVENAAKYGAPPITLAAADADGKVTLSVTDDGPGIPPEERERVLAPFYRADRARTPGAVAGIGLGLTLARRVAEVHGGAIAIGPRVSEHGRERGCRVSITIPRS